jgi:hypothetical protein
MPPNIALWSAPSALTQLDSLSDANQIVQRAVQLRDKERKQIAMNFVAGNFELAASFVWIRTMALLKKQLASLGGTFIAELLQRPDIDEFTEITSAISDSEAISLARDLGILTPLQTLRLLNSQSVINHFSTAGSDTEDDLEESMSQEEAVLCLKVCVQGILGHQSVGVSEDFKLFRTKLESTTFDSNSPEIIRLESSPYFFVKTAISILLSLFKTSKGAQLEHTARNAQLIIPRFWKDLKSPEKWQIGQTYAEEFSEGRTDSVKALYSVLLAVSGFDYVPENLRSSTFVRIASAVIAAHQGMNNFYNEPAPMRELASMGTSIPGPALAMCMTAVLCVKLGNMYGTSHAAQSYADQVLNDLSVDRWLYYFNERLEQDRIVLGELQYDKPARQLSLVVANLDIDFSRVKSRKVRALLLAARKGEGPEVRKNASSLLRISLGLKDSTN